MYDLVAFDVEKGQKKSIVPILGVSDDIKRVLFCSKDKMLVLVTDNEIIFYLSEDLKKINQIDFGDKGL